MSDTVSPDASSKALKATQELERAERRLVDRQQNLVGVEKERGNLRLFLVLAAIAPIPGTLIANWKIGVFACCSFVMFYIAGRYLNFMHVRNAKQDVENAEAEIARLKRLVAG